MGIKSIGKEPQGRVRIEGAEGEFCQREQRNGLLAGRPGLLAEVWSREGIFKIRTSWYVYILHSDPVEKEN